MPPIIEAIAVVFPPAFVITVLFLFASDLIDHYWRKK